MARILPPALSRTQEILSAVCTCTNESDGKTGPVCREPPEKLWLTGRHMALLLLGVSFVSGGFALFRKAKVLLKLDRSSGSSAGSEEEETEEQQLYNFIYATFYLLSHPSHCQVTAAYCDSKGKHTHTHTSSLKLKTLFKAVLSVAVSRPLCRQRKTLRT